MKDLLLRMGESNEGNFRDYDINNLSKHGWGTNEDANDELQQVLGEQYVVSYPKPSKLITLLLASLRDKSGTLFLTIISLLRTSVILSLIHI